MKIETNKGILTTGQFAKLCETTKETIMHYRRIGILMPISISETGYCYYSPFQFYDYMCIKTLQSTGSPLNEIKEYQQLDYHTYLDLLKEKQLSYKKYFEEEFPIIKKTYKALKNELSILSTLKDKGIGTPFLEEQAEEYMYESLCEWDSATYGWITALKKHIKLREQNKLSDDMIIFSAFNYEDFFNANNRNFYYCSRLKKKPEDDIPYRKKPEGTYLSIYSNWPWEMLKMVFDTLIDHTNQHLLCITGDFYVAQTMGKISSTKFSNAFAKISVLVQKKHGI